VARTALIINAAGAVHYGPGLASEVRQVWDALRKLPVGSTELELWESDGGKRRTIKVEFPAPAPEPTLPTPAKDKPKNKRKS
jgi:hypothetical protein